MMSQPVSVSHGRGSHSGEDCREQTPYAVKQGVCTQSRMKLEDNSEVVTAALVCTNPRDATNMPYHAHRVQRWLIGEADRKVGPVTCAAEQGSGVPGGVLDILILLDECV
jgi:hypothetical protein